MGLSLWLNPFLHILISMSSEVNADTIEVPQHVAMIMDGNGRWAKQRGKVRLEGHRAGAKTVERMVRACSDMGVKYLTLYAFSTENWKRPEAEVHGLMKLLKRFLKSNRKVLLDRKVRLNAIGRLEDLPDDTRSYLFKLMEETRDFDGGVLTLALSYGGRSEVVDAVKQIATAVERGELRAEDVNENCISSSLYTHDLPDPDLMIRTSGECRLSNFLLWQLSYSEFYFTDTLWPDFDRAEFEQILSEFCSRNRRFGGI